MKVAYFILAHRLPEQLRLLVSLCQHPDIDCFIHLDRKADITLFMPLRRFSNVQFIHERIDCRWGTFSLVEATINGIKTILEKGGYDYINFISGQDLPLQRSEDFIGFLQDHRGEEFMTCIPYDANDPWWKKNESRFLQYNFQNWMIPGKYRLQFLFNRIMPTRLIPMGHILSGNSQWFCITEGLAKYMMRFLEESPNYKRFFKYVWGADEFIFSTLAYNSPFRDKISSNLHYIDWDGPADGHPKTLGVADLHLAFASGKFFARKFDISTDRDAVEQVAYKAQ
jgi:Core-2/I-Branching enzyme